MLRVVTRDLGRSVNPVLTKNCLITNNQQLCHFLVSKFSFHNGFKRQYQQKQEQKIIELSTPVIKSKNEYFEKRCDIIKKLIEEKEDPYPHKFHVSMSLTDFINKYNSQVKEEEILENEIQNIAGRIISLEKTDVNSFVYEVYSEGLNIKVKIQENLYKDIESFKKDTDKICCGDVIGIVGVPTKFKTGQLSIVPQKIILLSPCLQQLPVANAELSKKETRYNQRYLDLILNNKSRKRFFDRAKIISFVRKYLDEMKFLEIETPVMNAYPSENKDTTFKSYHDDLNIDIFMRMSSDLHHKALIGEGIERVYEIGRKFINKKNNETHHSEFTTCEFYMAYADYNDLMSITENMLSEMVKKITGSCKFQYNPDGPESESIEIDFTPPFKKIPLIKTLEDKLNVKLPSANELNTIESNKFLDDLCIKHNVECQSPRTTARLLDKLVGKFIENSCINPTFIIDHPEIMSPLAKGHRFEKGLTERFDIFIMGHKIGHGYSVLTNPYLNNSKCINDEDLCTTFELGLPPLAGLIIGIDRLAMILTNSNDIKDVILFPSIKPNFLN
ncbi:hypothetical protein HCN44_011382 [Aphidius gifuensis]|uniref:Lysine--tRNA ligase n=1 Tax=Aphidius gifuensis TaxID=684658 RepID=A0A835CU97_APHGI|nr:lysine--tRNA ligase-like [Aphidius gifuensis]KAF7994113.1 hypothetical protein HCN44_011382 [Aphidius gifuensis]